MTHLAYSKSLGGCGCQEYYAASAKAVCRGINDATNAFALFAKFATINSDNVRSRYAKQPVKFSTSNAISAPRYS